MEENQVKEIQVVEIQIEEVQKEWKIVRHEDIHFADSINKSVGFV
jgi:hypothetical protein